MVRAGLKSPIALLWVVICLAQVPAVADEQRNAFCTSAFIIERDNEIAERLDPELRRAGFRVVEDREKAQYALRVIPDRKATTMAPGGTAIVINLRTGNVVWEKKRKNWYWRSEPQRTARKLVESLKEEFPCAGLTDSSPSPSDRQ